MTLNSLLLSLLLLAACASAQTSPIRLNFTGSGTGNAKGLSLSGSGSIDPYGQAKIFIGGSASSLQISILLLDGVMCPNGQFETGDELDANGSAGTGIFTLSGTATITGGKCKYSVATGSFTFTIQASTNSTADGVSFTMTGSGSITTQVAAAGPGGSGYPVAGPGGPGYPVSGPGGNGYPLVCIARAPGGGCIQVAFEGSGGAGSSVLVFDGSGSSGSSVLVFDGSGGSGSSVLTFDGAGGSGSSVLTFEGSGGSGSSVQKEPCRDCADEDATAAGGAAVASKTLYVVTPIQSVQASYTVTASCPFAPDECWVSVPDGAGSGTVGAASRAAIPVMVNPQLMTGPGTYSATISIAITPAGGSSTTIDVPLTTVVASPGPIMTLSQTGLQFAAVQGSATPVQQFVSVLNSGSGSMTFSTMASTLTGGNWLTASSTTSTAVQIQANPAGLAAGVYFGRVDFSSAGATNSPQSVEVVFTVSQTAGPLVSPAALTFVATANGNPASQTVEFISPSGQTLTVSPNLYFEQGSNWFSTATASGAPVTEIVSVDASGLAPGVYLGTLGLSVKETNQEYPVSVMLIVPKTGGTSGASGGSPAACTPTVLLPVFTSLEEGFATSAGIPVPVQASVADDCGTPLTSGAVMAYFSGSGAADAPVALVPLGNGQWTGAWMPHNLQGGAATVSVIASSAASVFGSAGVTGTLTATSTVPMISAGGVTKAGSSPASGSTLTPGDHIVISGANLAAASVAATTWPLPTALGGIRVLLGGVPLPLESVGPTQIHAILPYNSLANSKQQVIIERTANSYSMPETILIGQTPPEKRPPGNPR